ncbi:hypothetical protein J1614_003877 [Plenodomus biglobosus]|nr:hypothetical protein J1614_003877 [Plenodomus biglobosus]
MIDATDRHDISNVDPFSKTIFVPHAQDEKRLSTDEGETARGNDGTAIGRMQQALKAFERQLVVYNLEARGNQGVDPVERQDLRLLGYSQVSIMWFSVNLAANNIILGMLGPIVLALGFLDA